MRIYEIIFILRPEATDKEIEETLSQVTTTVRDGQGVVDKVESWGKRRLAYQVRGQSEGHYILVQYSVGSNAGLPKEIERRLKVTDDVLKYLTVRIDEDLKRLKKIQAKREGRLSRKGTREEKSSGVSAKERKNIPAQPTEPGS